MPSHALKHNRGYAVVAECEGQDFLVGIQASLDVALEMASQVDADDVAGCAARLERRPSELQRTSVLVLENGSVVSRYDMGRRDGCLVDVNDYCTRKSPPSLRTRR